jgi:hypothetical protein
MEPDRSETNGSATTDVGGRRISHHPAQAVEHRIISGAAPDSLVEDSPVRLLDAQFTGSTKGVYEREKAQAISLVGLVRHRPICHHPDTPTPLSE